MTEYLDPDLAPVRPRPVRLAVAHLLASIPTPEVAKTMGVTERTVQRWKLKGISNPYVADKLAVKVCGTDGFDLWGSDFDRAFGDRLSA